MKTLFIGIAIAAGMLVATRAVASLLSVIAIRRVQEILNLHPHRV
jgi:hypothetical protein